MGLTLLSFRAVALTNLLGEISYLSAARFVTSGSRSSTSGRIVISSRVIRHAPKISQKKRQHFMLTNELMDILRARDGVNVGRAILHVANAKLKT
jgi:hypothetical protein